VVIVLILKLPLLQIDNLANGCFSRHPIVHSQGIQVEWDAIILENKETSRGTPPPSHAA
jgi:hypothetical protein